MKIDRLIGIITVLLREEKVTAPYLADKFEVSRRTINRDIEDICKAGIPVVTEQGYNGGIYIVQGYKIDKALLTDEDLKMLLDRRNDRIENPDRPWVIPANDGKYMYYGNFCLHNSASCKNGLPSW